MQIKNSPRLIKNLTIGLVASSLGAFAALPSIAIPEANESSEVTEALDETAVESVEDLPMPSAEETLPSPEEALEASEESEAEDIAETEDEASEVGTIEAEADVDLEITEESDSTEVVADSLSEDINEGIESIGEDIEEGVEALNEDIDEGVEALDEDADEGIEAADEDIEEAVETEANAEMTEEAVETEADAEMTEEAVEVDGDAEMTEEAVETEAEATDDSAVEVTADEEINTEDFTIAELTDNSDSFTILAAALEAAGLTSVLAEEGPYTVFAPTDEAFEALPEGAVEQLMMPENKDVLVQVLSYHVLPGAVLSTDLESGNIATVEGSEVTIDTTDTVTVNNANVLVADVQASNGVIHIIDQVIVPPVPEADAEMDETEGAQ